VADFLLDVHSIQRSVSMNTSTTFVSSVPLTAAERAAAADQWERRGLLGRLVRVDDGTAIAAENEPRAEPTLREVA
jgi:hypothetical protein